MKSEILLKNLNSSVIISNGELLSFKKEGVEFIHQKGSKGWRNSRKRKKRTFLLKKV